MDLNVAMLEADTSMSPEPVLEISQQPQSSIFERRKIPTLQEFRPKKALSVIYFEYFRYSSSDCTKTIKSLSTS